MWDAELGNGDYFGFYWPLGRENQKPIVCEMHHDQWGLEPAFASAEKFIAWAALNGGDRGEAKVKDPQFAPECFEQANLRIARGEVQDAIGYLRRACESVPDACDYWFAMSSQLQRIGEVEESGEAALRAFRSGWHFGMPSDAVLRAIRKAQGNSKFSDDPIVRRSKDLTIKYGGEKENRNYLLLRECVDEYLDRGEALKALQVYQNFAFTMVATETTAFQQRYSFTVSAWQDEFSQLCERYLSDGRAAVT